MKGDTIKVGPFTWRRRDHGDNEEAWELDRPKGIAFFCVKNYGGEPNNNSGFSGWRLVSGGPFTSVGGWTSREAAMKGVVPFLVKYYKEEARRRIAEAERIKAALEGWLKEIEA